MGVYLEIPYYDRDIRDLPEAPVIINELDPSEFSNVNYVKLLMVTEHRDDFVESLAVCECVPKPEKTGRYNETVPGGPEIICEVCHSRVMSPIERGFKSDVWVSTPEGIESFILPNFLTMLKRAFKIKGFELIEYLCDPSYKVPNEYLDEYQVFLALEIPRGYNYFIRNFYDIFNKVVASKIFKAQKTKIQELRVFIGQFQHLLFPHYLPMPSKRSIITEQAANNRTFTVKGQVPIINAVQILCNLHPSNASLVSIRKKEKDVYTALKIFIGYHDFIFRKILAQKGGMFRKHGVATRQAPTYRVVVTSLANKHLHDEIHVPWAPTIVSYEPVLTNYLLKEGMSPNEIKDFILHSLTNYNQKMAGLLDRMIRESPLKGLPQTVGRNPTLDLRSVQQLYAVKVKQDVYDYTLSVSVNILKSFNMDFDGDAGNVTPLLSITDYLKWMMLSPHTGINGINKPNSYNGNFVLNNPIICTINNYLYGGHHGVSRAQ